MKKTFNIVGVKIEEHGHVFVIAEAGVNHNGELEKALALVDLSADIGADAVKFQTFKAEQVVTESGKMADYQIKNTSKEESQKNMLKKLELPEEFYSKIIARCKERGILFLSTPHGGIESLRFLERFDMPVYKIGSGDLTNYLLLDAIARIGKPMILSTGMSTLDEVNDAVNFIKSKGNDQIVVLHATSNYPCPAADVNMAAMKTLMEELDVPVGYSDHTEGAEAAIMATALGQAVYEFHITIDKSLPGPDHVASTDPKEARERVEAIRKATKMLGSAVKKPTPDEMEFTLPVARKSLVAAQDLSKGHVLILEDLAAKRPANGTSPTLYEKFIGQKLTSDVKKDAHINNSVI